MTRPVSERNGGSGLKKYVEMSKEELSALKKELEKQYEETRAKGLKLDMSRGKPSTEQLNLCMNMLDVLHGEAEMISESGVDCRN